MLSLEAGKYGGRAFTDMMYAKVVCVQLVVTLGYNVLFQGKTCNFPAILTLFV